MKAKQPNNKGQKGLSDQELIVKYETGKPVQLGKILKPILKPAKL